MKVVMSGHLPKLSYQVPAVSDVNCYLLFPRGKMLEKLPIRDLMQGTGTDTGALHFGLEAAQRPRAQLSNSITEVTYDSLGNLLILMAGMFPQLYLD